MKTLALILAVAAVLLLPASVSAQDASEKRAGGEAGKDTDSEDAKAAGDLAKLRELHHTLSFLNLLNGLHVTQQQFEKLIEINREVKKMVDENKEKYRKLVEEEKKVLTELEKVVRENKPIPKKLRQKVHRTEGRTKKARRMMDEVTLKYAKEVENVFTKEQQEVIKDFDPCTIPPKNLSDPVRVGQASDNEHVISLLRRIRSAPAELLEANMEKLLDRHMERLDGHKRLSEEEKAQERARLSDFIWKAHRMEELEFEMCKEELAEEFKWKDKAKDLQKELGEIKKVRHPKRNRGKASRYFLDPKIIPVLEERLAKLRSGEGGLKGKKVSRANPRKK